MPSRPFICKPRSKKEKKEYNNLSHVKKDRKWNIKHCRSDNK